MSEKVVLSAKKRAAIEALLQPNASRSDVARAAGVTTRTIQRWLADDDFKAALQAAQRALLSEATRELVLLAARAVTVLGAGLVGKTTSEQRRNAEAVLRHCMAMQSHLDFDERLAAIEETL